MRIGTVDKFQGQQAPVVIVSLTTSTPEDAPRGMDFLYSANRLNVATSRAKALCILVGSPRLFEPDCRTPQQMRLANAFCRYRELARDGVISQRHVEPLHHLRRVLRLLPRSFYWSEAEPRAGGLTPPQLTTKLTPHHAVMRGTEQQPPRCVALHGTIGENVRCVIHALRPSPCRDFKPRGSTASITSAATAPAPRMACRRCRRPQTAAEASCTA